MNKTVRTLLATMLCVAVLLGCAPVLAQTESPAQTKPAPDAEQTDDNSYFSYYQQYSRKNRPEGFVTLEAAAGRNEGGATLTTVSGKTAVLLNKENACVTWDFSVGEDGVYSLYPTYYQMEGIGKNILLAVTIDGSSPYTESNSLSLYRLWTDEVQEDGTVIKKDSAGDDLRPKQVEAPRWNEKAFYDTQGLYSDPYLFYLTAGAHTVCLRLCSEAVAISTLKIGNAAKLPTYKEYHDHYTRDDLVKGDTVYCVQAESATEKTSQVLYPVYDRSSAATVPNDPYYVRLNTIGQTNWNSVGQAISWQVDVPQAGLYKIVFRAKQNYNSGMNSYRTLYINGEIPFREAQLISFPYRQGWQMITLGNEKNSYYVWLEPGDTLTLECTPGRLSEVLRDIRQTVLELNELYRKIIVITGSTPDVYRDYYLEDQIPDLSETLSSCAGSLREIGDLMNQLNGGKSPLAATVFIASDLAQELADDSYSIPARLATLKSNTESLGTLINTLGEQPLELDYIGFVPLGARVPKASTNILTSALFSLRKFGASFSKDYSGGDSDRDQVIDVWVATGRDQVQILKNMVDDTYTQKYNTGVRMSLVDTGGNLIRATLAGKGPDVALMISQDTPVNLAMRGMLVDLTPYVDDHVLGQYRPAALTPFYYNGGLFALPETESFDMLFYRTDIFEELGLEVPQTWDDFYSVIKVLQANNLNIGVPEINGANMGVSLGIGTFAKFLFQTGGKFYNDSLTGTLLDEPVAQAAFTKWVELYSRYGLDRSFDFYNYFRSGEMPLGIVSFTGYNQFVEAAPEIRGLWNFALIPGTRQADGTIDRSETTAVTGCIINKSAQEHGLVEQAVEFIKWWTGEESQTRYGLELEAILGIAARYSTANLQAFGKLGWSTDELKLLMEQGEWAQNMDQIPGNYVLDRSLTSAFRAALNGRNTPARSLSLYNKDICDEITRKRAEFGLD